MTQLREQIISSAHRNFARHTLTQEAENRWLLRDPDSTLYHFRVVTSPGWITVYGDVGYLALSRIPDMIAFCRGSIDDLPYMAEKVPREIVTRAWSPDLAREWIAAVCKNVNGEYDHVNDLDRLELLEMRTSDEIMHRDFFYQRLMNDTEYWGVCDSESFPDCMDFTPSFYWCIECLKLFLARLDGKGYPAE